MVKWCSSGLEFRRFHVLNDLHGAMVVAVILVRVVEPAVHDVAGVVAVRDRGMPAVGAVHVVRIVGSAAGNGVVLGGVLTRDGNPVLFDRAVLLLMVKMPVMDVVDMSVVLNGHVAAV
jgi:hypothetical protein